MPFMINRASQAQKDMILNARRQHEAEHLQMQARFGTNLLVGNATALPKDVWGIWDTDGIMIQRDVLAVYNDLVSVSKSMPLGKLLHYFQRVSDNSEVNISLDGRSKARNDQPEFDYVGTPLPIVDSNFGFGWRQMLAAQTEGVSLDSGARINATRKVAEKLEDIVLNGDSSVVVDGAQLYGLRNHPKRITRSTGSTLASTTGANWVTEIVACVKALQGKNFYQPPTIYLNYGDWYYATTTEYTAGYPKKIIDVVRECGIANIVPASKVPANNILAVVKSQEFIQLLNGMPLMTRAQARHNPEDDYNFVVMAASALEIKYDVNDQCGVVHSS